MSRANLLRWLRALRDCGALRVTFADAGLALLCGSRIVEHSGNVYRLTAFGREVADAAAKDGWQ